MAITKPLILAIDTSCDETSVAILAGQSLVVEEVSSQAKLQSVWGGVVPMLAKRRHIERIEFVIAKTLYRAAVKLNWKNEVQLELKILLGTLAEKLRKLEAGDANTQPTVYDSGKKVSYVEKRPTTNLQLSALSNLKYRLPLDLIAVTVGPGLAVALEVGINAAKQLAIAWELPVSAVNHMEGHLWSGLLQNSKKSYYSAGASQVESPLNLVSPGLALLVSGNHTELVLVSKFGNYTLLGETLDDAVGEAFDKFAVMLQLGYPGGAIIEKLASKFNLSNDEVKGKSHDLTFPVPMIHSHDYNFSYSGIKTAALYKIQKLNINAETIYGLAYYFQQSIIKSLEVKLSRAVVEYKPTCILGGGGVYANMQLRKLLRKTAKDKSIIAIMPDKLHTGDNSAMIGLVGYYNYLSNRSVVLTNDVSSSPLLDRQPSLTL